MTDEERELLILLARWFLEENPHRPQQAQHPDVNRARELIKKVLPS